MDDLVQEFVEHRKDIKKPMTDRAIKMLQRKLDRLEAQGYSPELLLEEAMINGWQSVYPKDSCKKEQVGWIEQKTSQDWATDITYTGSNVKELR